jgi:hypothetical protein
VTVEVESPTPLPAPAPQLPAPPVAVSLPWVPEWLAEEQRVRSTLLLTHQPAPEPIVKPKNPFAKKVLNHA